MRPHPRPYLYPWVLLLALVLIVLAWLFLQPEDLAREVDRLLERPTQIHALIVSVSGRTRTISPEDTLRLHPSEPFRIIALETSRWRNYGLRLYSSDLDPGDFAAPLSLAEALGEAGFHQPRRLLIQVKEGRRVLAEFHLEAGLTVLDLAGMAERAGEPSGKIELLRQALALDPENQAVLGRLAEALEGSGDLTGAAETLRRLLEKSPQDPGLRDRLAEMLRKAGRPAEAARVYEEALGEKPDPVLLHKLLAIYGETGDLAALDRTWYRLAEVSPEKQARRLLEDLAWRHEDQG
ncbi:MAG: tetratricopeptide repeat protein, partial [Thermodesulfobacteriota bacterium]